MAPVGFSIYKYDGNDVSIHLRINGYVAETFIGHIQHDIYTIYAIISESILNSCIEHILFHWLSSWKSNTYVL